MDKILKQIVDTFMNEYQHLIRNGKLNVDIHELNSFVNRYRSYIRSCTLVDLEIPCAQIDTESAFNHPIGILFLIEYIVRKNKNIKKIFSNEGN